MHDTTHRFAAHNQRELVRTTRIDVLVAATASDQDTFAVYYRAKRCKRYLVIAAQKDEHMINCRREAIAACSLCVCIVKLVRAEYTSDGYA